MSAMAKDARRAMRAKAARMASNDPHKKVDASSWEPNEALNADKKTGARPIRPRIYKAGGAIQHDRGPVKGDRAPRNAGKACRGGAMAFGGKARRKTATPEEARKIFDRYNQSRDSEAEMKLRTPEGEAARQRENQATMGRMRAPRASGGKVGTGPLSMANVPGENEREFGSYHVGGYKRGGVPDAKSDMAMIKKAVHKHEKHDHKGQALTKLKEGGGTYFGGTRPVGGRMPHANGGRAKTKGKTNINIVIAQPKGQQDQMPPQGPVRPPMPPPQMQPPAAAPPPQMGGPPPGAMMAPPGANGPGGPMMRASGGRTKGDAIPLKHAGAGSGEGRLERTALQKRSNRARGGHAAV